MGREEAVILGEAAARHTGWGELEAAAPAGSAVRAGPLSLTAAGRESLIRRW